MLATHPRNPTRGRPQKPSHHNPHTTHPPKEHTRRTRTSPPKAEIPRGTPSHKRTGTTRHLQQARPRGLGPTHQRHPITPTIPQIGPPQKTHLKQELPQAPHHMYPQQTSRTETAATHRNQPPKKPQQT